MQFSVQGDHLHLIVEASDKLALSRGVQGLAIRIARAVNRLTSRRGKLWADRYFSRPLTSPRSVKHALSYVLNNFRKHRAAGASKIDPYSSAPFFAGFRELKGRAPRELAHDPRLPLVPRGVAPPNPTDLAPISAPRTWLARVGWQRAGTLSIEAAPRTATSLTEPEGLVQNKGIP